MAGLANTTHKPKSFHLSLFQKFSLLPSWTPLLPYTLGPPPPSSQNFPTPFIHNNTIPKPLAKSIKDIDANVDVSLVDETQERQNDDLMFDSGVLEDNVMHVEAKVDGKD
ncbi:hypothetical protein Tco_1043768 [Tanacetum coccineum]|uniref:Uncharacterized protein n=1 Tax=Tanacetum coccineum TaxID=301880 RepID=A0ABQ5GNC6_9ASTR